MPTTSRVNLVIDPAAAELLGRARQACAEVFPGTRVFLAYAHGSRVQGVARSDSDLDIGYYIAHDRTKCPSAVQPSAVQLSMAEEMVLADRLSRRVGVEVDLRNLGAAPLEWRARVLDQGCRLFCNDDKRRVALERELMTRWFDERPRLERIHSERLERFAATGLAPGRRP